MRVVSMLIDLFHSAAISCALAPWLPRAILLFFSDCGMRLWCEGWHWSAWIWQRLDLGFGFAGVVVVELAKKAEREVWKTN
jgi:hypothetical protein